MSRNTKPQRHTGTATDSTTDLFTDTPPMVTRRTPLAVRLLMIVLAVACAVLAALALVNVTAVHTYNQATASLERNLKDAADPAANLNTLKVRQQQTDDQFATAHHMNALLTPPVATAVDTNAKLSQELTKRIDEALAQQDAANNNTSNNADGATSSQTSLSEEQRQQIEQLLQQNGQQDQPKGDSTPSTNQTGSDSQVKPW